MLKWVVCYFLILESIQCDRVRPYVNYKILRISAQTTDNLEGILDKLNDVDALSRDHVNKSAVVSVAPGVLKDVYTAVSVEEARVEVLHHNLQELVDEEYRHFDSRRRKKRDVSLGESVKHYLDMKEINTFHDKVVASCSKNQVKKETIGYSDQGRPINVIRISRSSDIRRKTVFIEAGIHAREWLSPALANYIIYQLACTSDNDEMLQMYNWEILSVANPDGYHYTHTGYRMWRKNRQKNKRSRCVGTDLNRNFGSGFGTKGSSGNPCRETYRGRHAYSAPESRALRDYVMRRSRDIVSYVTIHTYGQYILLPWSYTAAKPPEYKHMMYLAKQAEKAMKLPFKIGSGYKTIYPAGGVSADFARDDAGITLSYAWELMPNTGRGTSGFAPRENLVPFYTSTVWRGIQAYVRAVANDRTARLCTMPNVVDPFLFNVLQKYHNSDDYNKLLQSIGICS